MQVMGVHARKTANEEFNDELQKGKNSLKHA